MTPYSYVSFVRSHSVLDRWDPRALSYLGLLPDSLGSQLFQLNSHARRPISYYKEVFRT